MKPYRVQQGMNCWAVYCGDEWVVTYSEKEEAEEVADMLNIAYKRGYAEGNQQ